MVQVGSVIELVVKAHDKGLTDFEEAVKQTSKNDYSPLSFISRTSRWSKVRSSVASMRP